MELAYENQIQSRLVLVLGKFAGIRQELYLDVAKSCLNALCKGMRIGIYSNHRQPPVLYFNNEYVRSLHTPHDDEWPQIHELHNDFGLLGYNITTESKRLGRHIELGKLLSAVEYIAGKLGCSNYASRASEQLTAGMKSGPVN